MTYIRTCGHTYIHTFHDTVPTLPYDRAEIKFTILTNYSIIYIPFRVRDRYYGTLAHKMFLRTPEATTHVYIHRWGPKATCHDTLEPIRNIGRVPTWAREAPGGRSSRMKF